MKKYDWIVFAVTLWLVFLVAYQGAKYKNAKAEADYWHQQFTNHNMTK